jgi:ADP-heptose:LPS heptosyltransferase
VNLKYQRIIDGCLGRLLCLLATWWHLLAGRKQALPAKPRGILVILLSEMGSLVLAQPMFGALRRGYPQAELSALVFAKNREVLELPGTVPPDRILTIDDRSLFRFAVDLVNAILTIRRLRIDVVIDCELFARISSLLAFASGAAIRVGFHPHTQEGLYRGGYINRPVPYNPYIHISRQFLALAAALESDTCPRVKGIPGTPVLPQAVPADSQVHAFARRFAEDFPEVVGKRIVLVYPGGGLLPIRAWPLDFYARLCANLAAKGHAVGVIGMAADKPLAKAIQAACPASSCIDLTGYTRSIHELMILFHLADLLITNDGGPVHFASLTPITTIALFGPATPALYGSLKPGTVHLFAGLACSPCLTAYNHRNSPCDGDNRCLKAISPDVVIAKALEILDTGRDGNCLFVS